MPLHCLIYQETRQKFFNTLNANRTDLGQISDTEKLCFIFSNKVDHIKSQSAKFCSDVLNTRRQIVFKYLF